MLLAAARKRTVTRAMREVAEYLGNTPTVARSCYVDPRVVDLYHDGTTIAPALEEAGTPDPHDVGVREAVEGVVLEMLRTGEEPG
jgi:DNA topoisomerase IB